MPGTDYEHDGQEGRDEATKFPDKEEMLSRLISVDDNQELRSSFYPHLLKEANNEFVGMGFAMVYLDAVRKFIKEKYQGAKNMTSPEAQSLITKAQNYLEVLTDNPSIVKQAQTEINEAMPHIEVIFPT